MKQPNAKAERVRRRRLRRRGLRDAKHRRRKAKKSKGANSEFIRHDGRHLLGIHELQDVTIYFYTAPKLRNALMFSLRARARNENRHALHQVDEE